MKRADLIARLQDEVVTQVAIEHQMEGTKRLYDACVLMGDNLGSDAHRQSLHTLLDIKLDIAAAIQVLSRQLAQSE